MSNPRPNLNNFLNWYTERKVKTRRQMKTKALECWQPIVKAIVDYVKRTDDRFASLRTFPTGSYYEGTKVKEPNEFDLMLVMEDLPIGCIGYRTKGNSATDYTPPLGEYIRFIRFFQFTKLITCHQLAFPIVSSEATNSWVSEHVPYPLISSMICHIFF